MAWAMAAQRPDWLGAEIGYDGYCMMNNGPMPLRSYLAPRYKAKMFYCAWRKGPPLTLP